MAILGTPYCLGSITGQDLVGLCSLPLFPNILSCHLVSELPRVDGLVNLETEFASLMESAELGIVLSLSFERSQTAVNDLATLVRVCF